MATPHSQPNPYLTPKECEQLHGPFAYVYDDSVESTYQHLVRLLSKANIPQNVALLHTMLDRGLPIETVYKSKNSVPERNLAALCVQYNAPDILKRVLPLIDIDKPANQSLLRLCVEMDRLELFKLTLERGANPDTVDPEGLESIFFSIFSKQNPIDYLDSLFNSTQFQLQADKIHQRKWNQNVALTLIQGAFVRESLQKKEIEGCKYIVRNFSTKEHLNLFKKELKDIEKEYVAPISAQDNHQRLLALIEAQLIQAEKNSLAQQLPVLPQSKENSNSINSIAFKI